MKTLMEHLEDYLVTRRALGWDLRADERLLRRLVEFGDVRGDRHLTVELFLDWKKNFGCASRETWAHRLSAVRVFAGWLEARDPATEVPPADLIAARPSRPRPYIYSPQELSDLVSAAGELRSAYGVRGLLWKTVFGLIASTGLRISEALGLEREDVDLVEGMLTIGAGKSGCARAIPVRSCVVERLAEYADARDRLVAGGEHPAFFIQENGTPATEFGARPNFAKVSEQVGLRTPRSDGKHGVGPRIHDLRHTFAVHTILDWFRAGRNVDREMYRLTTYLGHKNPEHTYYYMEAVPELLALAAERADQYRRVSRNG